MGPVSISASPEGATRAQRKRNLIDNTLDEVRTLEVGKRIEVGNCTICRSVAGGYSIVQAGVDQAGVPTLAEARRILQGLLNCQE